MKESEIRKTAEQNGVLRTEQNGVLRTEQNGVLRTEKLAAGYGDREVLQDLSFSVCPGKITALVGPNGAGKSTLLKTIARQLEPLKGTVFLGEDDMVSMKEQEAARRMSVILTERPRAELMTCFDVAAMGRYPYTGRLGILSEEDRKKVLDTMELIGVDALCDREFSRVSDGQRQLVLLARAICQEPEALVMDEPTSYLDIRHKIAFLTILERLARDRRIAVLVSLHELELAMRAADTVICVRDGKADRVGDPKTILTESYIEELYGMVPGSYSAFFRDADAEAADAADAGAGNTDAGDADAKVADAGDAGAGDTDAKVADGEDADAGDADAKVADAEDTDAKVADAGDTGVGARDAGGAGASPAYQFFQNQACEYFPCHKGVDDKDFNCLFCYCPLYALGDRCGGNFRYTVSGVKDCTNCSFPHRRENYRAVLKRFPEISALAGKHSPEEGGSS